MGLNVTGKLQEDGANLIPPGVILQYIGATAPSGWILGDNAEYTKVDKSQLWAIGYSEIGVCTISIANPGVITKSTHGLVTGQKIYVESTGALPTGLVIGTSYWLTKIDANTFKLSTTYENLIDGVYVETTGSQSGTHTLFLTLFICDSLNFRAPDLRGVFMRGAGTSAHFKNVNDDYFAGVNGVPEYDKGQEIGKTHV